MRCGWISPILKKTTYRFGRYGLYNPFLYGSVYKQIQTPVADLISQFLGITAGNLEDFENLLIRVMGGLSWTWAVIKKGGNSFFQMGTVFLGNLLQKRKTFEETSPSFADRILSKAYLSRYLHVI